MLFQSCAFSLVNAYGAFGSVGKERLEVILYGTNQTDKRTGQPVPGTWREYQFKCKPGDVSRRPCPSIFCRTLFQIERAALHSYGPDPHSR